MGTLLDDIAFNAIEVMAACVRARSAPHSRCISCSPNARDEPPGNSKRSAAVGGRVDRAVRRDLR